MTPAFKDGFVDELKKIAALALAGPALKGGLALFKSQTARRMAGEAAISTLGSSFNRKPKPSQDTGMNPPVGGL